MNTIKIKQHEILVDDDDYQRVMDTMKWTPSNNGKGKIYFHKAKKIGGKYIYISLHRFITGCPKGMFVDHINGNTLDNRKENLRICTRTENNCNMPVRKTNKTKLKGVSNYFKTGLFISRIQIEGKVINLGVFKTPEDAHNAYCDASKIYHGEYGRKI